MRRTGNSTSSPMDRRPNSDRTVEIRSSRRRALSSSWLFAFPQEGRERQRSQRPHPDAHPIGGSRGPDRRRTQELRETPASSSHPRLSRRDPGSATGS
ncbi:MAG: hypothetical protein MZV64_29670 [Ignavibacteriales bacterium]|nr:hypothetical protein [Ignavibacteriales bacterium]